MPPKLVSVLIEVEGHLKWIIKKIINITYILLPAADMGVL